MLSVSIVVEIGKAVAAETGEELLPSMTAVWMWDQGGAKTQR
jgi:hypothetical protein